MVVGDDVAVGAYYHSRAEPYLPLPGLCTLGFGLRYRTPPGASEEKFKERVGVLVGIAAMAVAIALWRRGIAFHADYAVDGLLGCVYEIGLRNICRRRRCGLGRAGCGCRADVAVGGGVRAGGGGHSEHACYSDDERFHSRRYVLVMSVNNNWNMTIASQI